MNNAMLNTVPVLPSLAGRNAAPSQKAFYALLLAMLLLSVPAAAKKHPVPLDPKADPKTCVECHEDKTKGKAVHSAIATGCTSCHEIRSTKDSTHVKLITTTTSALCLTCHTEKKAAEIKGHVHQPAIRDCVKCHDPHTSENKNQLLKATSGTTKSDNLCLTCHTQGTNVGEKGSRHAALDMGCDACHTTHKNGDVTKDEFRYHLTKGTPALCLDCHDVKDASLKKAHQAQPFEGTDCLQCHDPHQSRSPKLLQAFMHNPFENKMCDSCHQPAKNGKVVLTQADPRALCVTCHEDKAKEIEGAKVQHPGAMGACTDCHSPHAGRTPGFLRPDPVNACLNCHADQAEQHKKATLHQPAFEQGCATCHEPHGGDNAHLLRAKATNNLCLECHGPERSPQKLEAEHVVTIFDGKVKLPENYFAKVEQLPLRYGKGHPVIGHPTSDIMDFKDPSKPKTQMTCLSCHQPHSSAQPNLLVKDQANNRNFCDTCHTAEQFLNAGSNDAPKVAPKIPVGGKR